MRSISPKLALLPFAALAFNFSEAKAQDPCDPRGPVIKENTGDSARSIKIVKNEVNVSPKSVVEGSLPPLEQEVSRLEVAFIRAARVIKKIYQGQDHTRMEAETFNQSMADAGIGAKKGLFVDSGIVFAQYIDALNMVCDELRAAECEMGENLLPDDETLEKLPPHNRIQLIQDLALKNGLLFDLRHVDNNDGTAYIDACVARVQRRAIPLTDFNAEGLIPEALKKQKEGIVVYDAKAEDMILSRYGGSRGIHLCSRYVINNQMVHLIFEDAAQKVHGMNNKLSVKDVTLSVENFVAASNILFALVSHKGLDPQKNFVNPFGGPLDHYPNSELVKCLAIHLDLGRKEMSDIAAETFFVSPITAPAPFFTNTVLSQVAQSKRLPGDSSIRIRRKDLLSSSEGVLSELIMSVMSTRQENKE